MAEEKDRPTNFIREIINADNESGKFGQKVHTRFPPEPNGYLHIGHAKSICLNFGLALDYKGHCNLRFDDTNPTKEEQEYVDSIKEDVAWLGFKWDNEFYASDYFDKLHEFALKLIRDGKAYVDDLSAEEIRQHRGTLTEPGKESPWRSRPVDENLALFEAMRKGEFPEGTRVLRAKVDMASGNLNMRDPVLYRILKAHHHRTGDKWCIYPMYDWAHGQCDSLEGITHSICTLEFEDHRPLYEWFIDNLGIHKPQQLEFARLNLTYTVLSKRKLIQLVTEGHVTGWDDPRMPTISGLRRRGYTPHALRDFCDRISVAKKNSTIDVALLEHHLREDLNRKALRVMGVLRPLKIVLTNYPEGPGEEMVADNNPEDSSAGTRTLRFTRELYIEQEDFREDPPPKFFRLAPGREVRLKHGYIIKCESVVKDPVTGEVKELLCTYDPETKSGAPKADRKVKSTLHWVSAASSIEAEVRLYGHLFSKEDPEADGADFRAALNPKSLEVLKGCRLEASLARAAAGEPYQFLRLGYFCVDTKDSKPGTPVFLRTITLKDEWAKIEKGKKG